MNRWTVAVRVVPAVLLATVLGIVSLPWAQTAVAPAPASAPLQAIVSQVIAMFPRVTGEVIEVAGTTVTVSVGKRDGAVPGLELSLFREGRELRHPKTGEVLGKTEKALGRLRIEQV